MSSRPLWLFLLAMQSAAPASRGEAEPRAAASSFDCARVTSTVNKTICATPALAALDRRLADDFLTVVNQGGVNAAVLRADEARWLKTVRNACQDVACLEGAYTARLGVLADVSLRAASPAAYADTRPFPATAANLAAARGLVGGHCEGAPKRLADFAAIASFQPVIDNGGYVAPMSRGADRFAFLLNYAVGGSPRCTVRDVVVLPPRRPSEAFFQCALKSGDNHGFGMRQDGARSTVYWSIDMTGQRLMREPIDVIGTAELVCKQPESGE